MESRTGVYILLVSVCLLSMFRQNSALLFKFNRAVSAGTPRQCLRLFAVSSKPDADAVPIATKGRKLSLLSRVATKKPTITTSEITESAAAATTTAVTKTTETKAKVQVVRKTQAKVVEDLQSQLNTIAAVVAEAAPPAALQTKPARSAVAAVPVPVATSVARAVAPADASADAPVTLAFANLDVSQNTKKAIAEVMKYTYTTPVQSESIPHILEGKGRRGGHV